MHSSTAALSGFMIETTDTVTTKKVDQVSALSVQLTQANTFVVASSAISFITTSVVASTNSEYQFTLTITNSITVDGYMEVTLPTDVVVTDLVSAIGTALTVTCVAGCSGACTLALVSTSPYKFTIKGCWTTFISKGNTVAFKIKGFTNPSVAKTSGTFTLTSYDWNSAMVDTITSLTITPVAGSLTVSKFEPTDNWYILTTPSTYTVHITPESASVVGYYFQI